MAVGEANPPRAGASRGPAPGDGTGGPDAAARLRERLRAVACCLALTAIAFGTRPGAILADTKIDMAVNPLGFLGRALHLWDPEQFGQLQNQAVGYLFPMGPFFALGDVLGMPAWITQRFWLALLMCLAFAGTWRLAGRLGIGGTGQGGRGQGTRMFAAMAYALAPNGLATLGQISSEYLPVAMLPWIVLPLVTAASGEGGRLKAAARSGLAIACCGGINATATVAVLVVPFMYVVTRPRGSLRVRMLAWWSAAAGAATAWWLAPLLLTGTYGFSWLTYTEKADTTTGPTGLINVLRGAERWVNYLIVDGQVWWPVGHGLSLSPVPIICTGVVAALGLAGLLGRLLPERTFLLLTLLAGLAIVSMGHISDIPGPFAAQLRDLLDGPLAPLRNLHKFDAVVRLPLALGLAHLLAAAGGRLHDARTARDGRVRGLSDGGPAFGLTLRSLVSLPVAAAVALGGIGLTAISHGLSGPGEFKEVPRYWRDAASWINARAGQQGVLAVPGAPFGEYLWGRPMDDIVQPLLTARWGVRQLVPAGSPGYTRALDAIDQQVRSGQGSPGLSDFLGRMGVRYVLVRNDLRRETLRGAWPARLHQALDDSPGMHRVAAFGPPVGGGNDDAVTAVDQAYPPLEVYEVEGAADVVNLADATRPVRVYGGPESLLAMADDEALPDGPVLLDDDASDLAGTSVVTDSPRLLRRNFGELHQTSETLPAARRGEAVDVLDKGWMRYTTQAVYGGGVRGVTASTSAAGDDAIPQARKPEATPYAAFDGNRLTAWETGGWKGPSGQWLRVDFDRARDVGDLTATFVQNDAFGPAVSRVAVETENGTLEQDVRKSANPQALRAPDGPTRWLRLRITALASKPIVPAFARAAVAEVSIGGVTPTRTYTMPAPGGIDGPATYVMSRAPGATSECVKGSVRWVCSPSLASGDEEGSGFDRTFTSAVTGKAPVTGTAVLTDQNLVDRYTAVHGQPLVAASSTRSGHPADQARSGFDGDPATSWIAGEKDAEPTYTVQWKGRKRVSTVTVTRPAGAAGPVRLRVEGANGQSREGLSDAAGRLSFAPMTTDRLTITFFRDGRTQPVQLAELTVPGVKPFPDVRTYPLELPCGFGPKLQVGADRSGASQPGVGQGGGRAGKKQAGVVQTKATGTLGDLLAGRPLRFAACKQAVLTEGRNHLASVPFDTYRLDTVTVGAKPGPDAAARPPQQVKVVSWGSSSRTVEVDAGAASFLTVNENFNAGWRATAGGAVLRAVRLDGWKQGWLVPAGTAGAVELTYTPDRAQRIAVVTGLNLLLVLLIAAVWPGRSGGRRRPDPRAMVAGTGWPAWAAIGLAAALGGWIAGAPGVAVTLGVAALCGWARTRRSAVLRAIASPWTIAIAMLAGTGCLAAAMWLDLLGNPSAPSGPVGDIAPQLLGLVVVGRIAAELWRPRPSGGGSGGPIPLSWTAPAPGPGGPGPGAGPAAGPAAPPGSGSGPPLRWTPQPSAEDPSRRPPGNPGPSRRTRRR
ncbi:alpha-(1-_3)-arabinofuranosyltransferase domain-containing protein [Actinomadura chokoriensis]|uniref:Alpha-(1->3)-arabinofuranosyltransferase family protein n=1 Tax=Actinomadura chokoriensis TaxID=454156 RepID=A0ABV4QZ03_9ACTN